MNKPEQVIYNAILSGSSICTDSRNVVKNSLFFALKGEKFDGNDFAYDALEKGCKFAIIDNPQIYNNDKRLILVADALKTMQNIAVHHRKRFNIPFVGVTGSNGKTTTKELIQVALLKKFKTHATKGNFNNHIGVPLSLLSINDDTEIAIIEMGANHTGEIKKLCRLSKPTHGIITNIGKAHLEGFGSIDNILKTKSELYEYIKNHNGKLFVNHDDGILMKISENLPKITYGMSQNADYTGKIEKNNSEYLKISFSEKVNPCKKWVVNTNLVGTYNFQNVMAAICISSFFGVKNDDIKKAIETYTPSNNRSQLIRKNSNTIILDAYNANPSSMKIAVENFSSTELSNKVLILGDMLELGEEAKNEHLEILNEALKSEYSKIYLVGKEFLSVAKDQKEKEILYFSDTTEIIDWLIQNPLKNSSILIKGSRGIQLEKILDYL